MATSGYTDAYVSGWNTLRFNWWQIEQSISDNHTKIGWNIQLIATNYGYISSTPARTWTATINGSYYEGTAYVSIDNNTTKTLASGETIITHNVDGSKQFAYSFGQYFGVTFSGSFIGSVNGSGSGVLESIPRQAMITSAPDFRDTEPPTVYFENRAGGAANIYLFISLSGASGDVDIGYKSVSSDATSYTFNFTDDELNVLYTATTGDTTTPYGSNSRYITFYIMTEINGGYYYDSAQRSFVIADPEPDLNPTVIDKGDISLPLTGDENILLKYFNYPLATFNAVAKKGASIKRKNVTCGNLTLDAEDDQVYFNDVDSNIFVFTVEDSRGNIVTKTVTKDMIDYFPVTCRNTIDTDLNTDNTVSINLTIVGNYYEGSLGVVNNTLTVEYRYKSSAADYPEVWTSAAPTISDSTYTANATIANLDYKDTYTIQVRAKDRLYPDGVQAKDEIVKIVPVFDWGENDFNFNVPVTINGELTVNGGLEYAYPINSIYISYSNVSPASLFGGTWTRIKNTFLWGCDENGNIGDTGGEKTHVLTVDEMPSHTHYTGSMAQHSDGSTLSDQSKYGYTESILTKTSYGNRTNVTGGNLEHNNMPPYIHVAIWRRIA